MTDIVEEARAALESISDRCIYVDGVGFALVDDQPIDATPNDPRIARFVGSSQKLLAALADECERLRKQNSEYHRRAQVAEAAVLEEATRGHRLGHSVGRSLANAAASTAMRECERLRAEVERLTSALDAMTNQAVMASGRRATIVTEDGELERLRAENARLREAMPSDDVMLDVRNELVVFEPEDEVSKWLARLDAARKGVL